MPDARDQRRWHRHYRSGHDGTRLTRHPGDARARRRARGRPGGRAPPGGRDAGRRLVSARGVRSPPMIRILVVDDHALVRRGLIQLLRALERVMAGHKYLSPAMAQAVADGLGGPPPAPHEQLSDRELEVLRLLAAGRPITAISRQLGLSPKTVTTYRARLLHKLRMRSNAELTFYATQHGLISPAALRATQ